MRVLTRHLQRISIAAVLGLLTTVAVAWRFAVMDIPTPLIASSQQVRPIPRRGKIDFTQSLPNPGPVVRDFMQLPNGISVARSIATGRLYASTQCFGPNRHLTAITFTEPTDLPPAHLLPPSLHPLALPWLFDEPWPTDAEAGSRTIEAAGWPLLALACECLGSPNPESRYAINIGGHRRTSSTASALERLLAPRRFDRPRLLPLYPLWSGLLFNTACFTAAWWLLITTLFTTFFFVKSRLQARQGHCPTCRYDLRGVPTPKCPECGNPR